MKYWTNGNNSVVLDSTSTLTVQSVIGRDIPAKSTFFLKQIALYNASGSQVVHLYDMTAAATPSATYWRASIPCPEEHETTIRDFAGEGLMFSNGVCAVKDGTGSGYFPVGSILGSGYFVK